MKKKLTLWIILLLPVLVMAQEEDTVVHKKKEKPVKVQSINPNQQYQPVPDETKPDFSQESLFKALFVGGINLSQIDGDAEVGYRKVGAHIGVGTVVKFHKRLSVSMELIYSMEGAKPHYATYSNGVKNKYDITMDYINIPISLNVHDKKVVMFGAGLQLGVLARYSQTDSAGNNITSHPEPKGEQPRKFDLSGQVCATFFIKRRIGIGLRFQ
ncbi:MAG: PorT family protein, partial [Bacteroidetes bacterium]|nr:PorT family protein [Bacteroidota bacterium]